MRSSLAMLFMAISNPAFAQDRPAITPGRDVSVTYRIMADGQAPAEFRMSWLAARNLMRVDLPGGQGWIVLDRATNRAFMVTDAERRIMEMTGSNLPTGMAPDPAARFTREGRLRVAQTECVNWRMESRAQSARICLTSDGVMLRSESLDGPRAGLMEATAMQLTAQDPSRFERPAGYQSLQLPSGRPGDGGMPRGTALPPPGLTAPAPAR